MLSHSCRKRLWLIIGIALGLLVILTLVTPWQRLAENMLRAGLEAQGLGQARLTVDSLGFDSIRIRNLALGSDGSIILPEATIGYSLNDLWQGQVQSLRLDGLELAATRQEGNWRFDGVTPGNSSTKSAGFAFPVTAEQIAAVPLADVALTHGTLKLTAPAWSLTLPLGLTWQKQPTPQLKAQGENTVLKIGALTGTSASMRAALNFDSNQAQWRGGWQIERFTLQGTPMDVPDLTGSGTIGINADSLKLDGHFIDPGKIWDITFKMNINFAKPDMSRLTLTRCSLPWNGGTISLRDIVIPLTGKADIVAPLTIKGVSIDALMQQLTGKRATAQGAVSGTIPVIIKANGTIQVDGGNLTAEKPGVIAIDPDAIPGDNDQIALVRDVLKNLHYTLLSIGIDSGTDNKLAVSLTVEGKNPDAYQGRPVKLRVHLGGDVLEFVQQGLTSLTDPRQLLRQDGP